MEQNVKNIKIEANQIRICNNVVTSENFMKLSAEAIKMSNDAVYGIDARPFTVWQALCVTYFKPEEKFITANLGLSTQYIAETYGFAKRVVQRAIVELKEKGWLVHVKDELWALTVPCVPEVHSTEEKDDTLCTRSTQPCVLEVHSPVYQKYTESITKVDVQVDSARETRAPLTKKKEEEFNPANVTLKNVQDKNYELDEDKIKVLVSYLDGKFNEIDTEKKKKIVKPDKHYDWLTVDEFAAKYKDTAKICDEVMVCKESRRSIARKMVMLNWWNASETTVTC